MTKDVPECVTVVGVPARVVGSREKAKAHDFRPYGTPMGDMPDPVARAIEGLIDQVSGLKARIAELESQVGDYGSERATVELGPPDEDSSATEAKM